MGRAKIRVNAKSPDKMSEMILDYALPLLEDAKSPDEFRFSLGIAIMIWNAFLLPEDQRKTVKEEILSIMTPTADPHEHVMALNLYQRMYIRRKDAFGNAGQFVVDFEISEDAHGRVDLKVMCADTPPGSGMGESVENPAQAVPAGAV